MALAPQPQDHIWYHPAECAAMLGGTPHGDKWRARCPAHGGDNTQALGIAQGRDSYGNPMTLLHCFAHACEIEDICAAMGIQVRNLFAIHPDYAKATRHAPRARSPRIDRLKSMENPTPDEIAQILLEEMIVSDPQWIEECVPARAKMWELAQRSPSIRAAFTRAISQAQMNPWSFWEKLSHDIQG